MKDLSLPGSGVSAANWKLTALILGLAGMMGSSLPLASAATATTTTMTLTSDGSPVTSVEPHTAITLTAVVKAGSTALKQGQVKFCDTTPSCQDIHLLGLSQLTAAGTAALKFVAGPGSHSYRAVFVGTNADASSASAVSSVTVAQSEAYLSKTTLRASGSAGSYTLRADVSGVGATAPPTGTVYFQDRSGSSAELGKAQLSTGVEELSWPAYKTGRLLGNNVLQEMATADFNNDGHVDIAIADYSVIRILSGDGKGFFTESLLPLKVPAQDPYDPAPLIAGDFNNDGNADLVLASGIIFLGKGDGTFTEGPATRFGDPYMGSADFNGDGNEDLVGGTVQDSGPSLKIALGNGDGTFQKAIKVDSRAGYNLVTGDFDGDGKADIAIGDRTDLRHPKVLFYFGRGDGTFLKKGRKVPNFGALTTADTNGDGLTDLVVSGPGYTEELTYVCVLYGHPDKTFTQGPIQYGPAYSTNNFRGIVGDYDGDGIVDVGYTSSFVGSTMTVFLGAGKGLFAPAATTGVPDTLGAALFVGADFDEDGTPDMAAVANPRRYDYGYAIFFTRRNLSVAISGKAPQGPGNHEVVARYHGDDNFQSSVSKPVALTGLTGSAPVATLSALALPFGDGAVGSSSNAKTVVLTNTGTGALAIGSFTLSPVSGTGLSFATSNDCPASLAVGAVCKIRFRFAPGSAGAKSSQLAITDNAGNSPQVITLTGHGIAEPE